MAIQSQLFRRLEDHTPFPVIGWSIWLAMLQTIFFSPCHIVKIQRRKIIFLNLSNKRYFSGSKNPPYTQNHQ